jgi:hypothetical protein
MIEWTGISWRKLGFIDKFICWIMECVKILRFFVSFNGKLIEGFCPFKGLRQGHPLSPILFMFVAEGLTSIFHH